MPRSECERCGGEILWSWEEAFMKFGFMDGDGQVETWQVADVLVGAGYHVVVEDWGMHNTVIVSIMKEGKQLIPESESKFQFGYNDPRGYLPSQIVELLDKHLPSEGAIFW